MIRNARFGNARMGNASMGISSLDRLYTVILPAAFGLALLAGCGSSDPAPANLVSVSGTVTMGGVPLSRAGVNFVPIKNTAGTGAFGVTDDAGNFTLIHQAQVEGIEPGTYVVTFTKMAMKDGAPIPEGKTAADVEAVQIIPSQYVVPNPDSPVTVITPDQEAGHFNFEVSPQ